MVWEQRSATIVMMTKLEERARVKCDTYWPCEGSEMYGPIIVTLTDCMELATYTVRTFQIEKVSQSSIGLSRTLEINSKLLKAIWT